MTRCIVLFTLVSFAASLSEAQDEAPVKWTKGDLVMPKSEKIELKWGWETVFKVTDIHWPAAVQKVNGHWLLIGDDGTNRVDGKPISGWISNADVSKFRAAKRDRLVDQTAEQVVRQYTERLNKSNSPWVRWLRGLCLEQLGLFDAAIDDFAAVTRAPIQTVTTELGSDGSAPLVPMPAPLRPEPGNIEPAAPVSPSPELKRNADAYAGWGRCLYLRMRWVDQPAAPPLNVPSDVLSAQIKFSLALMIYTTEPLSGPYSDSDAVPAVPARYLCDRAQSLFNIPSSDFFPGWRPYAKRLNELALRKLPTFVPALSLNGDIFQSESRLPEAAQSYNKVIAADPTNALGYYKLAFLMNRNRSSTRGERQLAVDLLKTAAKIAGYTYPTLVQLRTAEYVNGNLQEAVIRQIQVVGLASPEQRFPELRLLRLYCDQAHVTMPPLLAREELADNGEFADNLRQMSGTNLNRFDIQDAAPIHFPQRESAQAPLNGPALSLSPQLEER